MAIAEVVAVLGAVNALASAVSDSAGHARSLSSIVSKLCNTQQKIFEVEQKHHGKIKLDQKSALDMSLAKKRAKTVQTQIEDHLRMAGLTDVLNDMNRILEEQRQAQVQEMADIRRAAKERAELISWIVQMVGIGASAFAISMAGLWIFLLIYNQ